MKKTIVTIGTVAVVMFTSAFTPNLTFANKNLNEVKTERKELKSELSKVEKQISTIIDDIKKVNSEITEFEESLKQNKLALSEVEGEISEVEAEIEELEKKIQERFEILSERAKSYQQSGGNITYLEVILGSKDFTDFISRVSAINQIAESDASIIKVQEEEQAKVEENLDELTLLEDELKEMEELIKDQKATAEKLKEEHKSKEKDLGKIVAKLKEEDKDLAQIESKLLAELTPIVEPETNHKAKSNKNSSNEAEVTQPVVVSSNKGGKLGWPTVGGYISSHFGSRWGRSHNGMDIARTDRSTKPPILAADGGTVETAGFQNNGYGNVVVINHGNGLKTKYAHLDSVGVSAGQSVQRGQQIGIMGTTGSSTGIHLHIEVFVNGSVTNPAPYFR